MAVTCCFIKEEYFAEHPEFIRMLDPGNTIKQSHRSHLCLKITDNENTFYLPLRNNLGAEIRPFGRIGHALPSGSRPNAGIDYRYALVINEDKYIEIPTEQRIPNAQYQKLAADMEAIQTEFALYLSGFLKAAKKNRIEREPLYRVSSLINFLPELGTLGK